MSADYLRETAEIMRRQNDGTRVTSDPRWLPVADWLDTAGADLWAHGPLCACGSGCLDCDDDLWQPHVRRAYAVARAWRGVRRVAEEGRRLR